MFDPPHVSPGFTFRTLPFLLQRHALHGWAVVAFKSCETNEGMEYVKLEELRLWARYVGRGLPREHIEELGQPHLPLT